MSFAIALLCGGPSGERGISLNTARSLLDHFSNLEVAIRVLYFNPSNQAYAISPAQLYSNTPSDFDFKLARTGKLLDEHSWCAYLKEVDLVFPAIHGAFGEDGHLQAILEREGIPFVGPSSSTCARMFDKFGVAQTLAKAGMPSLPQLKLNADDLENPERVTTFFAQHIKDRAVIKPVQGGSSLDVYAVSSIAEVLVHARRIMELYAGGTALLEPFCLGREFTVIVLQNQAGEAVPLLPSEIVKEDEGIFDYRGKYLPTNRVFRHCPPNFATDRIAAIRNGAIQVFSAFQMRDFARLDGWLMPDGQVLFTDLNPISGMEQNSFIFQQAAVVGLKHAELLRLLVERACARHALTPPAPISKAIERKRVNVLFGGNTAERQVSVMSGTNVWLKLQTSLRYDAQAFLLGKDQRVWHLPYALTLNHTVEEIEGLCHKGEAALPPLDLVGKLRLALGFAAETELWFVPVSESLDEFMKRSKSESAFVFLGLHGGIGENGTLQTQLEAQALAYNGSGPGGSRLCMDKYATGEVITNMRLDGVSTARKRMAVFTADLAHDDHKLKQFWDELLQELGGAPLIVKPMADGCSAGIVKLSRLEDLKTYAQLLHSGISYIKPGTFENQSDPIEMPASASEPFLLEKYILTDRLEARGTELLYKRQTGWIETTVGVRERAGHYHSLNPSITVARGEVLSLEEKFQGGTGVNITPPPAEIVPPELLELTKRRIEKVAEALGIRNYARIDLFLNVLDGSMIVIEANSLPGLTPSTVIYHQALAEEPPQAPLAFLEGLIADACADLQASRS